MKLTLLHLDTIAKSGNWFWTLVDVCLVSSLHQLVSKEIIASALSSVL